MKDVNQVLIRGNVVGIYSPNDKKTVVNVKTKYGSPVPNYPKIYFYGELAKIAKEKYIKGSYINISAVVVSRKNIVKKQMKVPQRIIATEIYEDQLPSINEVTLRGTIVKLYNDGDYIRLILKTINGNQRYSIETFLYTKDVESLINEYQVGNRVEVVGNIQTKKRVYPDVTKYYEDITLRKITKLEE